jgi:hypothetical protein
MGEMGDRIDRAERYVLGLMDEAERERAERDLENDPAFREALVEMAERMHVFDRTPAADEALPEKTPLGMAPPDQWRLLKAHIEAMPQMRQAEARAPAPEGQGPEASGKPATFGRRRGDRLRIAPDAAPPVRRVGLHSVPGRTALLVALALIAAFTLGYVAGVSSVSPLP